MAPLWIAAAAALAIAGCRGSGEAPAPPAPAEAAAKNSSPAPPVENSAVAPAGPANTATAAATTSPCLVQDDKPVAAKPLRAVGTEPFWAARVEGRCVTYMTPEDQSGTRVWTRFSGSGESGLWSGALNGKRFELRTRAEPGCSDGMSDKVYPIAVDLLVAGEQRKGCAEPAATGR